MNSILNKNVQKMKGMHKVERRQLLETHFVVKKSIYAPIDNTTCPDFLNNLREPNMALTIKSVPEKIFLVDEPFRCSENEGHAQS